MRKDPFVSNRLNLQSAVYFLNALTEAIRVRDGGPVV